MDGILEGVSAGETVVGFVGDLAQLDLDVSEDLCSDEAVEGGTAPGGVEEGRVAGEGGAVAEDVWDGGVEGAVDADQGGGEHDGDADAVDRQPRPRAHVHRLALDVQRRQVHVVQGVLHRVGRHLAAQHPAVGQLAEALRERLRRHVGVVGVVAPVAAQNERRARVLQIVLAQRRVARARQRVRRHNPAFRHGLERRGEAERRDRRRRVFLGRLALRQHSALWNLRVVHRRAADIRLHIDLVDLAPCLPRPVWSLPKQCALRDVGVRGVDQLFRVTIKIRVAHKLIHGD